MTKEDVAKQMAKRLGVVETVAETYVDHMLDVLRNAIVQGNTITLHGFGRFGVRRVPARTVKHIKDGSPCDIPAHMKVTYRPSRKLAKALRTAMPDPPLPGPTGPDLFSNG